MEEYLSQITHRSFANSRKILSSITEMLFWHQRNCDLKEERCGGEEQFHCGGGGGKLSSKTHSWPPGLREAGRRYSDLRPVFTRSNDFDSFRHEILLKESLSAHQSEKKTVVL